MDGNGDINIGQSLLDITLDNLILQSSNLSKSAGKSRNVQSSSKKNVLEEEENHTEKKMSIWNRTKPLTHIRNRKFKCTFYLHVHSVKGMPLNFDGTSLCVHWRRKDNLFRTSPSKVNQGVANFEETLIHKCTVYAQRNNPHHFAKYEERQLLLYVYVVGAPGLDVGKHLIDLTRLLPPTLEELEDEKSSGKWTTTFGLTGKAKGAALNVSFGYSLMGSSSAQLNNARDVHMFTSTVRTGSSVLSECPFANADGRHGLRSYAGMDLNNAKHDYHRHSESVGAIGPRKVVDPILEL
ncbi:unnamed protein product [Rhodiola kirilowii]